ncbi:MAG: hypothetical protein CO119_02065 [Flavobacteriales bacterium CG_4_9_14_3_um_filter_40_17]|nr:MAG: hypothetical protein CO119_02065 [Flavobacteriales bacterium CG_4_9_14_3_um_filter_40_17]
MKSTLIPIFGLLLLFLMSFISIRPPQSTKTSLEGPWKLKSIHIYEDNHIIDTIVSSEEYKQIKIYSEGKVMWTRYVPKDSAEWFGYGSFKVIGETLEETLEYGSSSMMKIIDTMRVFKFKLEISNDHYSQISVDANGQYSQAENYERIKE